MSSLVLQLTCMLTNVRQQAGGGIGGMPQQPMGGPPGGAPFGGGWPARPQQQPMQLAPPRPTQPTQQGMMPQMQMPPPNMGGGPPLGPPMGYQGGPQHLPPMQQVTIAGLPPQHFCSVALNFCRASNWTMISSNLSTSDRSC